jgi:hypothetical protein
VGNLQKVEQTTGFKEPGLSFTAKTERVKVHEVDGFLFAPFAKRQGGANYEDSVLHNKTDNWTIGVGPSYLTVITSPSAHKQPFSEPISFFSVPKSAL